jgi:1,4-alpha-glucan branching enzyme
MSETQREHEDEAVAAAAKTDRLSQIPQQELERLLSLRHSDPHSILGTHISPRGAVVRTYRPGAERVILLIDGLVPREMTPRPEAGLFEVLVEGRTEVFDYRLQALYPGDGIDVRRSPYAFLPTLSELDLYLLAEQKHERAYDKLGAHVHQIENVTGVAFAVWAPSAAGVSVVGDFNGWDGRLHMMRMLGSSGIWEIFVPDLAPGTRYKYEMRTADGGLLLKADPFAACTECPPGTASVVFRSNHTFYDGRWIDARGMREPLRSPISIYEIHLGSWRRVPEDSNRSLNYREMAQRLSDYVVEMGFTHVELMPVMEHPFAGSWGYQVTGYFAPTARFGNPDDFKYLVDMLHQRGIGVILDWVPAHFPTDAFGLGRFDGTALYEHLDPRQGHQPAWNTDIFNLGRDEVRAFLLASAHNWLAEYHGDGLRVDAVSSMLYLDYGREPNEWIPNEHGGRENLHAVSFLQELNRQIYARFPGTQTIAEESTAWPAVSRPVYTGGLGFGFKWDMGWMHDTLNYFSKDPVHRRFHHRDLTFGLMYAWSENFVLPLSHDEVVYGKRSLLDKMPGDRWQKFANLRALYAYMWARPGKKLLFMGGEFGQWREWNHDSSLDWDLLKQAEHRDLQQLVRDLNQLYRSEPALWEADVEPAGFQWIDANNADDNIIAFMRTAPSADRRVVCICNLAPLVRTSYRIGVPAPGYYKEMLNSDSELYGGSNQGNRGGVEAERWASHGQPFSLLLTLPPLGVLWFQVPNRVETRASTVLV